MVWSRETASQTFDTPEKRAELEVRIKTVVAQIRDENIRRHYLQDMTGRLNAYFAPPPTNRGRNEGNRAGNQNRPAGQVRNRLFASPSLLNSPLVKRSAARIPLREAALVVGAIHHPAILANLFDEFAGLPLSSPPARKIQAMVIDFAAQWEGEQPWPSSPALVEYLETQGESDVLRQMNALLSANRIWQALPQAAFEDALDGWKQASLLHLRSHTLSGELKAAERALAAEYSEENLVRLVEIRNEIEKEAGVEALIDGFGLSSGRPARAF
jgi:DNA primase